jgi:hypothetical protein
MIAVSSLYRAAAAAARSHCATSRSVIASVVRSRMMARPCRSICPRVRIGVGDIRLLRTHRDMFLADPPDWPETEPHMEFRLTYSGQLYATQRDARPGEPPKHTVNRREIRRVFHIQLKQLWETTILPRVRPDPEQRRHAFVYAGGENAAAAITIEDLSKRHALYGFNLRAAGPSGVGFTVRAGHSVSTEWPTGCRRLARRHR